MVREIELTEYPKKSQPPAPPPLTPEQTKLLRRYYRDADFLTKTEERLTQLKQAALSADNPEHRTALEAERDELIGERAGRYYRMLLTLETYQNTL